MSQTIENCEITDEIEKIYGLRGIFSTEYRPITGIDATRYPVGSDAYLRSHQHEITIPFPASH